MRNQKIVEKYVDPSLDDLKEAVFLRNYRGGEYDIHSLRGENKGLYIESVAEEIHLRLNSIKKQIFEIGGLLYSVKRLVEKGTFCDWIKDNFPFSHKTANNYMNVYKACLGLPEIVDMFKPSILYEITNPKFPEELREEIFSSVKGQVVDLDKKELLEVLVKYQKGEIALKSSKVRNLIRHQKDEQIQKRYEIELKAAKRDIAKRLSTVKKLNETKDMEPLLTNRGPNIAKKYKEIEEMLEGFIGKVNITLDHLHQN